MMTPSGRYAHLVRAAFWLYVAAVIVVALQPSTPPTYLGRYSQTSLTLLIALIIGAAPVYLVLRWLAPRVDALTIPRWLAAAVLLGVGLALAAAWAVNLGTTPSYLFLRLGFSAVLVMIALWGLERLQLPAGVRWLLPLALITLTGAVVWLARDYPGLLWTDEGYMASVAQGYIETGITTITYYRPLVLPGWSLMYNGLAGWYTLFGFGFETGRLFILTVGLLSIALTTAAARNAYRPGAAGLAALAALVAVLNLNVYRQDIEVALWLGAALLVYTLAERYRWPWLHILAGFFVAFSVDGHPTAYRFSLGFGAAYLTTALVPMWQARRFIMDWRVVYLMIGGVLGVGAYVGMYFGGAEGVAQTAARTPVLLAWAERPTALLNYALSMLRGIPLLLLPALLGIGAAIRRREPLDVLLLWTLAGGMVLLVVYPGLVRSYYVAHLLPVLLMLAARGFAVMLDWQPAQQRAGAAGALAALLLVASVAHMSQLKRSEPSQSYDAALAVGEAVRAQVGDDESIVTVDPLFFAFHDHPGFYEVQTAAWAVERGGYPDRMSFWQDITPDVVVTIAQYPSPYPDELLAYTAQEGFVSVACWQGHNLGRVDLLRRPEAATAPPPTECPVLP